MTETANGGQIGQIQNTEIRNLYNYLLQQNSCGYLTFRLSVAAYVEGGSTEKVEYDAKTIDYTVDGQQRQFVLPKMTYIGYTQQEIGWIDSLYGAMVDRLESGDVAFIESAAMQELKAAFAGERDIYSLRAPDKVRGGADPGGSKGIAPQTDPAIQETLVVAEDLHKLRSQGYTERRVKAEFLSRVFHEMLHRNWLHNRYAYDANRVPGNTVETIIANLEDPFTLSDLQQLDRVYLETKNALTALASDAGLSATEIDAVFEDSTSGALKSAQNFRIQQLFNETQAALGNPAVSFTEEQLRLLDKRGLIRLKEYPPDVDTREEKAAFRRQKENYEPDYRFTEDVPTAEDCSNINYQAIREGAYTVDEAVEVAVTFARNFFAEYSSEIGQAFGSALGRHIARNENQSVQLAASTTLGVVGQNLGEVVEFRLRGLSADASTSAAFDNIGADFRQAGIGALSSVLAAELIEALGLEGTLAELGQSIYSAQVSAVVTAIADGTSILEALQAVNVANIVGGFIGTKLAAELVEFDTIGGQIGAAVGSAVGTAVGIATASEMAVAGAKLGMMAGPLGALVGAFAGYIFGGLIGSMFGGTPRSGADLGWNEGKQEFGVTRVWSKSGGSKDAARGLGESVSALLNTVVAASSSNVLDGAGVRTGAYGMKKKDFVYWATGGTGAGDITFSTRDANALINHGAAIALSDLVPRLMGGDVFVKRAVAATLAHAGVSATNYGSAAGSFDLNVLIGNLSTAKDYGSYLQNRDQIDVLIMADPSSAFTAGWSATFARAMELGLLKRASTDWIGGWNVYMDEKHDEAIDGVAFTPANMSFGFDPATDERLFVFHGPDGEIVSILGDTIDTALKDSIVGTNGNDTIIVSDDRIANTTGLTIDGQAASGAEHVIRIAARLDGGAGHDTIVGGDLGNDLIGDDGNDTLVGGKHDDWLFGGTGNDRLFAGAANYSFTDGDVGATAAALDTEGNGDLLDGGDGDDVLYGSRGSDWLRGGDGNDRLFGGSGGDILDGGAGDDSGPAGEARLFGGAGTDQYVFRYGSGIDTVFDEADHAATPGVSGDSFYSRLQQIQAGTLARNWAGGGDYEADGSVRGGEDAISFGVGIGMEDLILQRSGQDLTIRLTYEVDENTRAETGDQLIIKDWFESTRRVEWLRFADGEEVRIGDIQSFLVGSAASDVVIGTNEADFLYGGAGHDVMWGLDGDDFGFGGAGNDLVAGDNDNDWVAGGLNDDKVMGGAGNDTVFGDSGDDEVSGGAGSDIVVGGLGDDLVVGGAGNDVFRYQRGDGRDVLLDDYVNNWEVVWQSNAYVNGYVFNLPSGTVTKDGVVHFDGQQWIGQYDFDYPTQTFRRHLGAVDGALATNAGTDYLEFGAGINIQDLAFRRTGNDLEIAIGDADSAVPFDDIADRITIRDWYLTGNSIENFVFLATGRHQITNWNLTGGSDGADTLTGTSAVDWLTGNGGDDTLLGNGGNDILSGNGGADLLRGAGGADVLYGGANDDVLDGGVGADTLIGGSGFDVASYANAGSANRNMRAFLGAPHTNTFEGAGDTFYGIEGIEATAGADMVGGDANGNLLRGLGGNDVLLGGAGDDVYEFNASHGQDTIADLPFVTEEILAANGALNTALFTASWTNTFFDGENWYYQLIATRNGTGEEVYRSGEYDYVYASAVSSPPSGSSWLPSGWVGQSALATAPTVTGNGSQVVREVFEDADGGSDTIELGPNLSLSDLTFLRLNGNADLRVNIGGSTHFVTITGQANANSAIESLQLRDGLTVDLTRLVLVGETASSDGDFLAGNSSANTLEGLGGDDVLSGHSGNDTLRGGDGDDVLEGGAGSDTLDGGNDSVSAGLVLSSGDQTRAYGDTIRYVRSNAAVTIDLAARTATGGHATGDTIVAANGVSSIENVIGSEGYGDTLRGDARANRLVGFGGNDVLEGRAGNDVLVGGLGDDQLYGGDDEDNLAGEDGLDVLEGGNGKDLLAGGAGADTLRGDAGEDVLSGGEGDDTLYGGTDADMLGGDAGDDLLYGEGGNDRLAGGDGADQLYGGDQDDQLVGEAGDDLLSGDAGNDVYYFDAHSGADVVLDSQGDNRIIIDGVAREQIWLTRSGDDLRIGIIGGTSVITLQGYYASAGPTRIREIALLEGSLFLGYAEPLITAMTGFSVAVPSEMPAATAAMLAEYWHERGVVAPTVVDQIAGTNEDSALNGSVDAIDQDENIVSYALERDPDHGVVVLDTATGAWTYTPDANAWGEDSFEILVVDADGHESVQSVTVNVASVNDAPTDVLLAGAPAGVEERDRPQQGAVLDPIVLGTLSAVDVDAPDPGDFASHVFSVSDARFEIVNGNVLRLRANQALDFESSPTVSVDVTATDRNGAGLSHTRTLTFNVLDRDDYFYGTSGANTITGTAGRNIIYGQGGNDVLTGANANDDLHGGDGADALYGQGGNDLLSGDLDDDDLDGGTGNDTLWGGDGNDELLGGDGDDTLNGEAGLDTLVGGAGADQLDGGADNDSLQGGDGNDRLVGGAGNDVLVGGLGADRFLGGSGSDRVTYAAATSAIAVNLATGTGTLGEAAGDIFEDTPEVLEGSAYGDTITGSAGADRLIGGAGNDTIYGGAGNDVLEGGDGDDTLAAESGDDQLNGGAGNDILIGGANDDTYLLDINSGADEIRNFDASGEDVDVVGYQGIANTQLWFERSGDDLVVSVVGTSVRTTIKDWYLTTTASERADYRIDFFLAGEWVSEDIDAEALVNLMAGYAVPATQAAYDALHANPTFSAAWNAAWGLNAPPTVPTIATQTINEDGTLTLTVQITDDFTPAGGISVIVEAVRPDNHNVIDTSIVNAPTIGAPNANGERTLTVTTKPNASGQVAIKIRAIDAGGLETPRVFLLNVAPVPDTPTLPVVTYATPQSPLTKPTLDSGSWSINIQGALTDQDGSEVLDVRVSNVPAGISFNTGTNLGGGVWSFGAGPWPTAITGPASWSQDLALTVTAIAQETATGATTTTSTPLNIVINARPTDLYADRTLAFNENTAAGVGLAWFGSTDADAGDTATYEIVNSAGGRFAVRSDGWLSTGSTNLDYETATSHTITVRVTDSGGLTRTEDFVIAVNNVNEAPTNIWADRTLAFDETIGTWVGIAWFGASDPENNVASYSIVNDAGGRFWVRSDGLLYTGGTPLDYETGTSHTITVRATDAAGLYRDQNFTVNVNPVNESSWVNAATLPINEAGYDGPNAYLRLSTYPYDWARITGGDPEGNSLSFETVGGDTNVIWVDSAGYLRRGSNVLDYETRPTYSVIVRAWDGTSYSPNQTITIATQPVEEAPEIGFSPATAGTQWLQWQYSGTVTGWDPENAGITFELVSAYAHAVYNSPTYTSWSGWSEISQTFGANLSFNASNGQIYAYYHYEEYIDPWGYDSYQYYLTHYHLNVRVRDAANQTSTIIGITTLLGGTSYQGAYWTPPVVLDLDDDGIELVQLAESNVSFRLRENDSATRTGWVGADDGILALDRNGDGAISFAAEISFIDDLPGATTDLEGLAAYDTDQDGQFDTDDARYSEFVVWNDANQDGVSQADELRSLSELGVEAIGLTRSLTGETTLGARDNVITATSEFLRSDGSRGLVGDVVLASEVPDSLWHPPAANDQPESTPVSDGSPSIDHVDRRAIDERRLSADAADLEEVAAPQVAQARGEPNDGESARNDEHAGRPTRRQGKPWRWSDFGQNDFAEDELAVDWIGVPRDSALHASLSSVVRRRLQMVEAMASFAPESAAVLELQAQRRVDPRTLELLTSVPQMRVG